MGEAADPSLLAQARHLLVEESTPSPAIQTAWLSTALACHGRMLERADHDRPAAVELAIAAADLIQRLLRHSNESAIPDWLPVHEEQCCRYGAIWIHELLQEGHPMPQAQTRRALALLERLQQLHPEPVPWITGMRSDLEQALPGSPPQPPDSIYDCIWVSDHPLQAMEELGRWAAAQAPGSTANLQQLVEAASRTRAPHLLQAARERLRSHPPEQPWHSLFALQLEQANGSAAASLRPLARRTLLEQHATSPLWDEHSWRALAGLLHDDPDPLIQETLQNLLRLRAPLEQAHHAGGGTSLESLLAAEGRDPEDARRAAQLYAQCPGLLRRPYAHWADPEAIEASALDPLINCLQQAREQQRGFSLVRLGDGEGLFLCGRRPDLGGAIGNGTAIDERLAAQGGRLEDPEHGLLRRQLAAAVANANWIGIPDVQQCLSGPPDCVSVASGLRLMLSPEQWRQAAPQIVVGGCHVHNALLQAGCYSRPPFTSVQAVIGPSLPQALRDQAHVLWLPIPGEARLRADAFGAHAHYPRVFEQTLAAIAERISPGDLVLVGAGILGKIYCEAVRVQGGIAVDVGSVLDLCSGYGGTRGEYRLHPWLHHAAGTAFRQA